MTAPEWLGPELDDLAILGTVGVVPEGPKLAD
jgi:hypothetical protein